jgi:hypothetical protein
VLVDRESDRPLLVVVDEAIRRDRDP